MEDSWPMARGLWTRSTFPTKERSHIQQVRGLGGLRQSAAKRFQGFQNVPKLVFYWLLTGSPTLSPLSIPLFK